MALSKSKIDYLQFVWNVAVGCQHGCEYCFALRWAKRMKCPQCQPYTPHLHWERWSDPNDRKKPARIGVGFFADLAGDWTWPTYLHESNIDAPYGRPELWANIARHIAQCPQHRFITLTKAPENIPDIDIPDNWWIGVSVTGSPRRESEEDGRVANLSPRLKGHTLLSHEPWLGSLPSYVYGCFDWVILGGLTGKGAHGIPQYEILKAAAACKSCDIPLFVKRNAGVRDAPQEYPKGLMLPGETQ